MLITFAWLKRRICARLDIGSGAARPGPETAPTRVWDLSGFYTDLGPALSWEQAVLDKLDLPAPRPASHVVKERYVSIRQINSPGPETWKVWR